MVQHQKQKGRIQHDHAFRIGVRLYKAMGGLAGSILNICARAFCSRIACLNGKKNSIHSVWNILLSNIKS